MPKYVDDLTGAELLAGLFAFILLMLGVYYLLTSEWYERNVLNEAIHENVGQQKPAHIEGEWQRLYGEL